MIRRILSGVTSALMSKSCHDGYKFLCTSEPIISQKTASFTSLILGPVSGTSSRIIPKPTKLVFLEPKQAPPEQIRTLTKFSWKKGRRKTVHAVRCRFFRLHWGIWVRTMAGKTRMWAKKRARRNRLNNHVFCNATQSYMLDKMVNRFWRKPKYYIDDPYAVYHERENFAQTRRKPWRPEGVDYE